MEKTDKKMIPIQTLRRLPIYLHYLKSVRSSCPNISATAVAEAFGLNDVQVRKDLSAASGSGRPKTGYNTQELIEQLETCLGCRTVTKTVLVGAGNLGKALLSYSGFRDYGLDVIAAFDKDSALTGTLISGKPVLPMEDLEVVCAEKKIHLGIITVPVTAAQTVCNQLISYGIRAIWNFAPTILKVPKGVLVENENLASSLAVLNQHLQTGRALDDAEL